MKIKERLIGLTLIGLIATAAWVGMTQNNTPAPDITLTSITGKQITLKNLREISNNQLFEIKKKLVNG